jgi:SAM-dependent methyltransferase
MAEEARPDTDREWEQLARHKPYWAVLTQAAYDVPELDGATRESFFANGEEVVAFIAAKLARHFGAPTDGFRLAVDFGCGVGRLTAALARRARQVIGVDVAPTMLAHARANLAQRGASNATFVTGDDELAGLSAWRGQIDLIVSMLVFQHIPPARGERLLARLLDLLAPGGWGYLHFPCTHRPIVSAPAPSAPQPAELRMFSYDLTAVLEIFMQAGIDELFCRMYGEGLDLGVEIALRKPARREG